MIDSSGNIYAIDLAFARSRLVLFNTPIPVFTVGSIPDEIMPQIENLKASFVTRGLQPPTRVNANALIPVTEQQLFSRESSNSSNDSSGLKINLEGQWKASPFIIYTEDRGVNDRELFGIYHREVTLEQFKLGFAILNLLAYAINPDGQSDDALNLLRDKKLAYTSNLIEKNLDVKTREAFMALTPQIVGQMTSRLSGISQSINNHKNSQSKIDEFLFKEWQSSAVQLHERAMQEGRSEEIRIAAQKGDLGNHWQELIQKPQPDKMKAHFFKRLVNKKNLKLMAAITAGYAAVVGAHLYGGAVIDGTGPAWAVHIANQLYSIMPETLKNAEYRVTMFKGMHFLSTFLMFNILIGAATGKSFKWDDIKKTMATIGCRVSAKLQFNVLERFSRAMRQPTLFTALRSGVNPFAKVLPDSPAGQIANLSSPVRPGLNNPFLSPNKLKSKTELNNFVLEAKSKVNNRKKVMAALLADLVVAEQFGIDPVTLIMSEQTDITQLKFTESMNEVARLKTNEEFLKKWTALSHEVYFALNDVKDFKNDLSQIHQVQVLEFYKIAKAKAQEINRVQNSDSNLKKLLFNLKSKWHSVTEGGPFKAVGNFGYSQYQFLRHVEPTKFVSDQAWGQFWIDFLPTVVQIPLFGDRANISHPHELAHSEQNFGWTTPGHFSDMGNQYAVYSVQVPGGLAQVYGDQAVQITEGRYSPIENITYESIIDSENFMQGIWGWMKGAGNLPKAGYGYLAIKSFVKRIKAIQSGFIMDFSTRVFIAGQAASAALPAFVFMRAMAYWMYGWFWDPAVRGNQLYEDSLADKNNEFNDIKTQISKGLRLEDDELLKEGNTALNELYQKNEKIITELKKTLEPTIAYLEIPEADRAHAELFFSNYLGAVVRLEEAIIKEDFSAQEKAVLNLRSIYEKSQLPDELKNDAQALLEYSIAHPPFKNGVNTKVTTAINYLAGAVTTYLGTNMFVDLLRSHDWGPKIAEGAVLSAALYYTVYKAQRGIDNLAKTFDYIKLRKTVPVAAFEMAAANHPKFNNMTDYAEWIKKDPTSSDLIRNMDATKLAEILKQDMSVAAQEQFLKRMNERQKPDLSEIKSCALLLSKKEALQAGDAYMFLRKPTEGSKATPMTRKEKIKNLWKGLRKPPTN
jgi:hypothetical protein